MTTVTLAPSKLSRAILYEKRIPPTFILSYTAYKKLHHTRTNTHILYVYIIFLKEGYHSQNSQMMERNESHPTHSPPTKENEDQQEKTDGSSEASNNKSSTPGGLAEGFSEPHHQHLSSYQWDITLNSKPFKWCKVEPKLTILIYICYSVEYKTKKINLCCSFLNHNSNSLEGQ